jgi:hypothetical protein
MDLSDVKTEEKKISDFLEQKVFLSQPNISNEDLEKFKKLGFDLHFLPSLEISEEKKFSSWLEPPKSNFYQLIKKGKLSLSSSSLTGRWVLIEGRHKPVRVYPWLAKDDVIVFLMNLFGVNFYNISKKFDKQQYENDFLLEILKKNGFSSRFSLSWRQIDENIKPAAAEFLQVDKEKMRLPYFIEWNFLSNLFYPQWGKTSTWEWFQDRFKTGECLAGGAGDLSSIGWDPPDYWSAILGFRFLIEI